MSFASHIEEVLKLVAETGDRCIVVSEGHEPFVVMDLSQYRALLKSAAGKDKLAGLTEIEMLEKINQDIAEWRESRAEDLTEYEVSQFQIDKKPLQQPSLAPMPEQRLQRVHDRPVPNLPIVDDSVSSDYHLEPLG